MKWCIALAIVCCATASAQGLNQNESKLEPYQLQALKNALRPPNTSVTNTAPSPFAKLPAQTAPNALLAKSSPVPGEFANACAIPLLLVPGNPDIDTGIQRKLDHKAFSADHMPVAKGLPPCRQGH